MQSPSLIVVAFLFLTTFDRVLVGAYETVQDAGTSERHRLHRTAFTHLLCSPDHSQLGRTIFDVYCDNTISATQVV
jgi:hypothetical protein